jgi:hypothetical protein
VGEGRAMSREIVPRIPKKRATTVERIPRRPFQKTARPMTLAESRAAMFDRLSSMRGELLEYLIAFLGKQSELRWDLKEYKKGREYQLEMLSEFGARLEKIERRLKIQPFKGKQNWKSRKLEFRDVPETLPAGQPKKRGRPKYSGRLSRIGYKP